LFGVTLQVPDVLVQLCKPEAAVNVIGAAKEALQVPALDSAVLIDSDCVLALVLEKVNGLVVDGVTTKVSATLVEAMIVVLPPPGVENTP
jgi:hypothetical protein